MKATNEKRGVWFPKALPGEQVELDGVAGSRRVGARLKPGQAADLDHTLDLVADHLADEYAMDPDAEMPSRDQLRAGALAVLADPYTAALILDEATADPGAAIVETCPARKRKTARRATVFVHVDADSVQDGGSNALVRVEDLGPMLLGQLAEFLGRCEITVSPVIDLREFVSVNAYEHPPAMKTRTELRTTGAVFPHSTHQPGCSRLDHDPAAPYEPGGPPGQTSDLNDAPQTRRHHRIKTHLGYTVRQIAPGRYEWTTPHGLRRVVDQTGTHLTRG